MVPLLPFTSDERLVALTRAGNQHAFELIYDRHHRGILSFCRHMLSSREEAEDAVQHTFMAAYRDMVGSDKPLQVRAWLYAIARNRCLSILRQRRDKPLGELEDVPTEGLADEVQRRQDLQDLLRDLAALPEEQRAALVLAEIGDLPHHEIAAVIGCPKDKVKALVFQARSSLHASRQARDTDCVEIRQLISTLSGPSLRRTNLRRHLRECPGCRAFQEEVRRQRTALAVVLPVIPTLGLKDSALAAAFGAKAGAGAATAGAAASAAAGSGASVGAVSAATPLVAKVLVATALIGGGAAGVKAVADKSSDHKPARSAHTAPRGPAAAAAGAVATVTATATADATPVAAPRKRGQTDRGKAFALTRGKGLKRGLRGTQPGKAGAAGASADAHGKSGQQHGLKKGLAKKKAAKKVRQHKAHKRTPVHKQPARAVPTPAPKPKPTPRPKPTPTPVPTATAVPTEAAPTVTPQPESNGHGGGKANARD
jgi:RNA polymerase sigma factor (sigma-70 family)